MRAQDQIPEIPPRVAALARQVNGNPIAWHIDEQKIVIVMEDGRKLTFEASEHPSYPTGAVVFDREVVSGAKGDGGDPTPHLTKQAPPKALKGKGRSPAALLKVGLQGKGGKRK